MIIFYVIAIIVYAFTIHWAKNDGALDVPPNPTIIPNVERLDNGYYRHLAAEKNILDGDGDDDNDLT